MFSLEYKPGVFRGGSVICPISSLTMSQVFLGNLPDKEEARHTLFYRFTQPFRTPLYVVAYDIQNDKRRTKVHKVLKGFGEWTEFSPFECFLTKLESSRQRIKKRQEQRGEKRAIVLAVTLFFTHHEHPQITHRCSHGGQRPPVPAI